MLVERLDPFVAEFDRLTQQLFGHGEGAGMPIDVTRQGEEIVVRTDLPGVPAESISVTFENSVLTVSAERHANYAEGERVIVQERFDGTMTRRLRVPEWVDGDRIAADYADGVLTLRLPVGEKARPRRIEVRPAAAQTEITAGSA
ncbi:MAG: Hsp20/alpha crystallin family protein [Actinomycetota bacterium]|nr:Hsp20/alpha crystallin family protein [Actinomycetota bacterium]